ncbi:MAG: response regulator [Halobacteriovoraceae bacterium]|nr:response regulator [Halobacteriovoraceae bacterium]
MKIKNKKDFKILIVDDSDLSRRTMVDILKKEDYNSIGEASSSEKAIKVAIETKPSLYIIDVVMPNVSGLDLIKHLKGQALDAKMIMTSSLRTEYIIVEAISNGASDFLQKPFSQIELISSVDKIYSGMLTSK